MMGQLQLLACRSALDVNVGLLDTAVHAQRSVAEGPGSAVAHATAEA